MAGEAAMASRYQVLEELGSGSFGVVYKAIERSTGDIVAIKHIDLESSEDDIQEIQQEIAVLSTCASPFVTQYKTSFLRGHKLWIVMEYLGGGSCLDLLKPGPFNEAHIAIVCRELLLGLDYLHREGKIHRDIKAANILLSSTGKVKLADFGVATQLTNIKSQRNTFVGTPFWMAPEVIQQAGYDFKADIWSLGITAMELVNGEPPNASTHPMKALFVIPKAPAPRLEGNQYSRDFRDFVASCLVKDPERRPTAKELLAHRFIRGAGKVEALQELIERRQQWDGSRGGPTHPKFYEETMNTMSPKDEQDGWIFDTVKASTVVLPQQTPKRRKVSETAHGTIIYPEEALQQLNLNGVSANVRSSDYPTVRKASQPQQLPSVVESPSPAKKDTAQRQPLGPDLSFGNSGSTMRLFQRAPDRSPSISPEGSYIMRGDENRAPWPETESKEAKLGRKAYNNIFDPAFQETHAQTSSQLRREALARVANAWGALDIIDPEGEYQLLRSILSKVQSDPRFAHLLPSSSKGESPQKPKLVLAQANPHLKSHRRRQSCQVERDDGFSEQQINMPGQLVPGKDHIHQLSNVLYGRWVAGLANRWSMV